jgi:hypothetical protein
LEEPIVGHYLEMYGQNDKYAIGTNLTDSVKLLESMKCQIGLANPRYRISDESFCRQRLSRV